MVTLLTLIKLALRLAMILTFPCWWLLAYSQHRLMRPFSSRWESAKTAFHTVVVALRQHALFYAIQP